MWVTRALSLVNVCLVSTDFMEEGTLTLKNGKGHVCGLGRRFIAQELVDS